MGSLMINSLLSHCRVQRWKSFDNQSTFAKVIAWVWNHQLFYCILYCIALYFLFNVSRNFQTPYREYNTIINKLCAWRHNMLPPRPLYARCSSPPVHSLHDCSTQRALCHEYSWSTGSGSLLGSGVQTGLVDIHYVVTWTANQSGLLTLKVVSESCVPILVFLGLSVLDLGQMYETDRQTDARQKHRLMPPPMSGEGIIICNEEKLLLPWLLTEL